LFIVLGPPACRKGLEQRKSRGIHTRRVERTDKEVVKETGQVMQSIEDPKYLVEKKQNERGG
jgi:hypothetical protein